MRAHCNRSEQTRELRMVGRILLTKNSTTGDVTCISAYNPWKTIVRDVKSICIDTFGYDSVEVRA
jgi:hypothetical protein